MQQQDADTLDEAAAVNHLVAESAALAARAIAYQQMSLSLALAVQSTVDQLQSLFSLNVATTAKVFSLATDGEGDFGELEALLAASQETVHQGIDNLGKVVAATAKAMQELGPGSSS